MHKGEGRDAIAPDGQEGSLMRRLQSDGEDYLRSVSIQPDSTLLTRIAEAVLTTMFRIRPSTSTSFDNRDFITKLGEAEKVEIRCRTFYLYYSSSKEQLLKDVFTDLEAEVYTQIISAYTHKRAELPAAPPSLLRILRGIAKIAWWRRRFPPDTPAGGLADSSTPKPIPPASGLKKMIDHALGKECKRRGIAEGEVNKAELTKLWEGIANKPAWLRDNVIGCWLRRYPKDEPFLEIHVVGRPNLYYRPELEEAETNKNEPIYLAGRLKFAGEGKLNVHDYNRRTPEYVHIIDTYEKWEFSVGSLEHDHIIVDGADELQKCVVTNVRWEDGWPLIFRPPENSHIEFIPVGYKCPYLEYITTVTEVGYVPNLRPRGRVLPRFQSGERMKLLQDAAIVRALAGQGVTEEFVESAIEIEPGECWLVSSNPSGGDNVEAWLCFSRGQDWGCQKLEHRGPVSTGNNAYVWRYNNPSAALPTSYVGELEYAAGRFKPIDITAIKGQRQVFGKAEPFSGLRDNFLSTRENLVLHSQGRDHRTRALYYLEHSPGVLNSDLFIIHFNNLDGPLYLKYSKPGEPPQLIRYADNSITDVELDEKNMVKLNGENLLLSGESILLICGTSTLMLNTSSSIRLGSIATHVESEMPVDSRLGATMSGWASIENVESTLRKSPKWSPDLRVERPVGDEQGTYTQGFIFNKDGAWYFVKCYRSDLREDQDNLLLARQEVDVYRQCADLSVVPPLFDVLPSKDIPQLLVMPRLIPLAVTGLSMAEILVIGYAMSILLERLEERLLVHYDIRTTKFGTDRGQIKLIDYNSVFPVLDEGQPLQPLHRLLVRSGLPEEEFLSPERREFLSSSESERPRVLTKIGPASSIYALAKVLLSIRRGLSTSEFAQQWEQELGSGHGQKVGALLEAMLTDDAAQRPTAKRVKEEMRTIIVELKQELAEHQDVMRADTLLGSTLD